MPEAPPVAAVPGCKSATQRALMLAASARGGSVLRGAAEARDSVELAAALSALGVAVQPEPLSATEDAVGGAALRVSGLGAPVSLDGQTVEVGEGASTLRFLLPWCAAGEGTVRLRAAPGLRRRAHGPLLEVLATLGAKVQPEPEGWTLQARGFALREAQVDVAASSQFLSGLMMASGAAPQRWTWQGLPVSAGYLAMTVGMLRVFRSAEALTLEEGAAELAPGFGEGRDCTLPADASAMLTLAVGALLAGRPLAVERGWSTRHPDAEVLHALQFGGLLQVHEEVDGRTLLQPQPLESATTVLEFALAEAPDAAPVLAALGLHLPQGLLLHDVARLRDKESDRLAGVRRLVEAAGGSSQEEGTSLRVLPTARAPASERLFDPEGDHRMAMAAGLAGLRDPGLQVEDRACVAKSFPGFWEQRELLT